MSMRIESQTSANTVNNARSAGTKVAGLEAFTGHMPISAAGADEVNLSSASGLVSLAKSLTPADKETKIAELTTQVRSGQYRVESLSVSRSIIQSHF